MEKIWVIFLFGRKNNTEENEAANRKEFDQLAETVRNIYDHVQEAPQVALKEIKVLLTQIKGAHTLDRQQRAILRAFAHDTAGYAHLELNHPEEALSEMEKALRTYEGLQDKTPLVNNYLNQSRAWLMKNDMTRTFTSLERGLALAKEGDLPQAKVDVLYRLGLFYKLTSQTEKTMETFRHGLLLSQELGDRSGTALFMSQLGQIYLEQDDLERAENNFQCSATTFEEYKDVHNLLLVYNQLSQIYVRKLNYPKAQEFAQKGLDLARTQVNLQEMNSFLHKLAWINYNEEKYDAAICYGLDSLKLSERVNSLGDQVKACSLLSRIFLMKEDLDLSRHYSELGYNLTLTEENSYKDERASFLDTLADIKLGENDKRGAIAYLEQADALYEELGDISNLTYNYLRLGNMYLTDFDDPASGASQASKAFELCLKQAGRVGMLTFNTALNLWQVLARQGYYAEGLLSAGHCLEVANAELQVAIKAQKEGRKDAAIQQNSWLLFVQNLVIVVATIDDLRNNSPKYRPKVDEILSQLENGSGDAFGIAEWVGEMYSKIQPE